MYFNTAKGHSEQSAGSRLKCLTVPPSPLAVSLRVLGLQADKFPFTAAPRKRVLQRHMTLLFPFQMEREENFCTTSTEQNIVTSETSVWDRVSQVQHRLSYRCSCRVLSLFPPLPHRKSTAPAPLPRLCQIGLLARSHKDSRHHPPFIPNHVLLNYSNPMHLSLCNM